MMAVTGKFRNKIKIKSNFFGFYEKGDYICGVIKNLL